MDKNTILTKVLMSFTIVMLSYTALFINEERISKENKEEALKKENEIKVEVLEFKNEEGNPNKICCHRDCGNRVANQGQTKNCVYHSYKCKKCGKLISEGLDYCKECILKYNIRI